MSSSQWLGADRRFWCFPGPLILSVVDCQAAVVVACSRSVKVATNVEKCAGLCAIAWRRRRGKIFRLPIAEIAPCLASLASLHMPSAAHRQTNIPVTLSESSSAANCLLFAEATRIFQRIAIPTRPILPWIVRPHDLKAWDTCITCVPKDPHCRVDPSMCTQSSYIAIVPGHSLTGSL